MALFIPIVADIGANLFSRSQFWPPFLSSLYYAGIVIAGLERVLGQTLRSSDPAEGRGPYSSTFDAPGGVRILAPLRTVLQHGGTITLDQTGPLKKMVSLTLPLYHGQQR